MCSRSRATIFTGPFPAKNGVTEVLQFGTDPDETGQVTLHPSKQNMAKLLESAGYNVQYRGKWHMSKDPSGTQAVQSRRDLECYHFEGWRTPERGVVRPREGRGDAGEAHRADGRDSHDSRRRASLMPPAPAPAPRRRPRCSVPRQPDAAGRLAGGGVVRRRLARLTVRQATRLSSGVRADVLVRDGHISWGQVRTPLAAGSAGGTEPSSAQAWSSPSAAVARGDHGISRTHGQTYYARPDGSARREE